ncbi:MAG: hypothetical protein OXK76_10885 [Gammaproteobacteria bacterium]|nr:hypothetical protein [Gammaproteobacteria bacterium]
MAERSGYQGRGAGNVQASSLLREFFAVALAEMRAARRLARTWVFVALTLLLGMLTYLQYSLMHAASGFVSTFGSFGPRVLVSSIGMTMVIVMVVGMVFLAFDIRSRDQRERMAEVLDARPVGTVNLLAGRLTGLVFVLWLAVAVVMGLIQLLGITAKAFNWWGGDTLEPVSLTSFLLLDAIPVLALWGSLVVLLAVTIRNRLIVVLLALGLFGVYFWGTWETPFYLAPGLASFQAYLATGSDMLPQFADGALILQRVSVLILSGAFIVFAAALHPRSDGQGRGLRLGLAAALAGLASAGIGAIVVDASNAREQRTQWIAAQVAAQDEPRADLDFVQGSIAIDPGRRLDLDLVYRLDATEPMDELQFSFNPGLQVAELLLDGVATQYTHDLGILRVPLPRSLGPGERVELAVKAAGVPDDAFGYLDSELDMDLVQGEQGNVVLLGTEAAVFAPRFVALMPTVRWMPLPGPATGSDDPVRYGRDFFNVELDVEVPPDWLVAGPGRRQELGEGRFRFAPSAPVPEVALLASRFERRHLEVADIAFELLLFPGHGSNLVHFADAIDQVEERIGEILAAAGKAGLAYPYGGLSLVEVPARLRVFGGGWRMDTVQALPGIMLLREYGLPTARFDTAMGILRRVGQLPDDTDNADGAGARIKIAILEQFFRQDFSGGNLHDGVARNFLKFQTGAHGRGAIALDYVCHELMVRLLYNREAGSYFSPRTFSTVSSMNETMGRLIAGLVSGGGALSITIGADGAPKRASVWSRALGTPLDTLDPAEHGVGALDVLSLKAPAVAKSIVDGLGRDIVAEFLAELRRRHAGRNFTAEDFDAVAAATGVDLGALLGDWLGDAQLPGFVASTPEVLRLKDGERGEPRYQVRVHVHNGEPTPGLVRVGAVSESESPIRSWTDPIPIGGRESVEAGLVVDTPPGTVWISPYLSLNRNDFRLALPDVDPKAAVDAEPLNGSRKSQWRPPPEPGIVVDDLDPGFTITYASPDDEERYGLQESWWTGETDIDQGLPVYNPFTTPPRGWMRMEVPGTWGRYRHTAASAFPGDGGASARFTAQLPQGGRWRVDYHLPEIEPDRTPGRGGFSVTIQTNILSGAKGSYGMKIVTDGEEIPVEFDAEAASVGWNDLGEFSLPAGEASLVVSNQTSGSPVIADAVRWRSVEDR